MLSRTSINQPLLNESSGSSKPRGLPRYVIGLIVAACVVAVVLAVLLGVFLSGAHVSQSGTASARSTNNGQQQKKRGAGWLPIPDLPRRVVTVQKVPVAPVAAAPGGAVNNGVVSGVAMVPGGAQPAPGAPGAPAQPAPPVGAPPPPPVDPAAPVPPPPPPSMPGAPPAPAVPVTPPAPPLPTGNNVFKLEATAAGQLKVVESGTRSNGQPRVVARSYDNNAWEPLSDQDQDPLEVVCRTAQSTECVLIGGANPQTREIAVPDSLKNVDAEGLMARLLLQATFGSTREEIKATVAAHQADAKAWLDAQMSVPPSLLREYIRARTNPTMSWTTNVGRARSHCDVGARYRKVTSGGSAGNTQNVAANNLELKEIGGRGHVAVVRFTGCDATKVSGTTAYIVHEGQRYRFVPRLKLLDNTLANPAGGVGVEMCPSVAKTFVNKDFCVRRASCGAPAASSVEVPLNQASLRRWFTGSKRYVYYVTGLKLKDTPHDKSPCQGITRWRRDAGKCAAETQLDATTKATIVKALTDSKDRNSIVRDIELTGRACTAPVEVSVTVGDECMVRVHPEEFSVRDFTAWGTGNLHPGNAVANPNPIYKWARNGGVELKYPASHPMTRWGEDNLKHIPAVGRYGDRVDFQSLNTLLQTPDMATFAGAASQATAAAGFESCGAPGESANDGTLGHRYIMRHSKLSSTDQRNQLDWVYDFATGKSMAWMNHVMEAPDQMRQRVAWALQQIFTIADNGDLHRDETEIWATYYDIFVRHAFGNYRDMMREVSFHPLMAEYLTFLGSRSFERTKAFPDENYAREIMQLFSIGLYQLNQDGTRVVKDGDFVDSYTDVDIVDFARVWTGFDRQQPRSNVEDIEERRRNTLDPMVIKPANRDWLPKAKLDEGYLGDQYPLCSELPARPFLRGGARFVYTGGASAEGEEFDAQAAGTFKNRGRFAPAPTSPLYIRLCGPKTATGACTFPSEVVLTETLQCSSAQECNATDIVTVMIENAGVKGYYTYVKQPCVDLTFFEGGKLLQYGNNYQCGNPEMPVGTPTCCEKARPDRQVSNADTPGMCLFGNEMTTWEDQKQRCESAGLEMCTGKRWRAYDWSRACARDVYQWTANNCSLKIQVLPTGLISLVDPENDVSLFRESNGNLFRVRWATANAFPRADVNECGANCAKVDTATDSTCVCDVEVTTKAVFTTTVPDVATVLNTLKIGSLPINSYDAGEFTECTEAACQASAGVKVWVRKGSAGWAADTTVFEVSSQRAGDSARFLLNRESVVAVKGQATINFRNPPHFMPLFGEVPARNRPWRSSDLFLPRAEQEVEALLDHLFYHKNTAPFVAYRLIQRMVTSNPSPRYVKSVADAFASGTYRGQLYSGRYGDMKAAVAAVFLDQEARSTTVEADPTFGSVREPLLKVVHFLRSLEFKTKDGREVAMPGLIDRIGEEAFKQPSVFGFYLPEFRPDGPVEDAGLVAPESQILTPPLVVNYFNGMTSLIENGLTHCDRGFGYSRTNTGWRSCLVRNGVNSKQQEADGAVTFKPTTPADAIAELDLVLTSKRLSPATRAFMEEQYQKELAANGADAALKHALKMFIASAEFQVTNANILTPIVRQAAAGAAAGAGRKYKAVIVVFQGGGADSFNLVVPHSGCAAGKVNYNEYKSVRTNAAIDQGTLQQIRVAGQPCSTFGVHPELPTLKTLYDANDAAFVANIGGLVEPLTKDEYRGRSAVTKKRPPSPSAHNIAQRSLQNVHAQDTNAKGILGRTFDALKSQATAWNGALYSIAGNNKMTQGILSGPEIIDRSSGVVQLVQKNVLTPIIDNFTHFESQSVFAETYAQLVGGALKKTDELAKLLDDVTVPDFGRDSLNRQFQQVAKLIKLRTELKHERAAFFTSIGGWDTHTSLTPPWGRVEDALSKLVTELKAQGVWNDVVILSVSDFGRTMTSNGQGTDHAWGGNHFVAGGSVRGRRFHGQYPDTLKPEGDMNLGGRGRLIPYLGWESLWAPIVEWMGVTPAQIDKVLPNLHYFTKANRVIKRSDLFTN